MPIEYRDFITREDVRRAPEALFVFGDNVAGKGFGGQAREMRGEPNTVGIPTKWKPTKHPDAFFRDADLFPLLPLLDERFTRLRQALESGVTVVIPTAGVGSGLADLKNRAPAIRRYINGWIYQLEQIRGPVTSTVTGEPSDFGNYTENH